MVNIQICLEEKVMVKFTLPRNCVVSASVVNVFVFFSLQWFTSCVKYSPVVYKVERNKRMCILHCTCIRTCSHKTGQSFSLENKLKLRYCQQVTMTTSPAFTSTEVQYMGIFFGTLLTS